MRSGPSLYEVLQVDRRAEPEVVEAAYRRLARKYHPDTSGLDDGGRRMMELSAAYEVLRDQARRAAYDRELRVRETAASSPPPGTGVQPQPPPPTGWSTGAEQPRSREAWLACRQHLRTPAVGQCESCGAALCGDCFESFQPASCPSCILGWASQRRRELVVPALWFLIVLVIEAALFLRSLDAVRQTPPLIVGLELLAGYMVASFPSGWRIARPAEGDELDDSRVLLGCLLAAVLGPIVAPFRMIKIVYELRQVRQLEALARGTP
jgi:hypothetical protein